MPGRIATLNIISPDAEHVYLGAVARCLDVHRANSLAEVRPILERALESPTEPIILDLMGHSTRDHHLLRLGNSVVDMLNPAVARFFKAIAEDGLLSRLEVTAVRLMGCETAAAPAGQRTLRMLSNTLRLPVFGSIKPIGKSYYDALGFNPAFNGVLVEASELL